MNNPEQRLAEVRKRIREAAQAAGRREEEIKLIAVSKRFSADDIIPVIEAGQTRFGENRVQEAKAKWPALRQAHPDIELHLIGPLQSNKCADAVALFDVIHTVDRQKIARALKAEMEKQGRKPRLLVQVNTGEEPQKAGIVPRETSDFIDYCKNELGLDIIGLMCIPPIDEEAALHFALLKNLAEDQGLKVLSMGMSGDFETAIALGATHIRIGTAIFGQRDYG